MGRIHRQQLQERHRPAGRPADRLIHPGNGRGRAKDLKAEAERATDPEDRRRLKEKARRIESES
ncbi:DUF6381 family protein, partial [Streptomyces sp. NPDC005989]|uniref:DUF6381 family protein n=1 Tax=Streptomyces sp. NPDC005989 TaxID=3156727 RepID=UPI0033FF29E0